MANEQGGPVDPRTLEILQRISDNPVDLIQGQLKGYLEDFIRITVGSGSSSSGGGGGGGGGGSTFYVAGDLKTVITDLTAQAGAYEYEDDSGTWLYCNGAVASQTTYADLYAAIGPNAFGTDSGGNFSLPDARGRALFFTGTHADTDLGDSDGVSLANRRPKHQHTTTASGTTSSNSAGTPAGSVDGTVASHSHGGTAAIQGVSTVASSGGTGFTGGDRADVAHANQAESPAWSGSFTGSALSGHQHTVSTTGTAGSGMSLDAPPYLFIGSLLVRV
jgi:microcystin-dependent protein